MTDQPTTESCSIVSRSMTADSGISQTIPCGEPMTSGGATIQLEKNGDQVVAINVHCSCGVVTKVSCQYE